MKFKKYMSMMMCVVSCMSMVACSNPTPDVGEPEMTQEELEKLEEPAIEETVIEESEEIKDAVVDYSFLDEVHSQLDGIVDEYTYSQICEMIPTNNTAISAYIEAYDTALMLEHVDDDFSIQLNKMSDVSSVISDMAYQYFGFYVDGTYYTYVYDGVTESEAFDNLTLTKDQIDSLIKGVNVFDSYKIYSIESLGNVELLGKRYETVKLGIVTDVLESNEPVIKDITCYISNDKIEFYESILEDGTSVYYEIKSCSKVKLPTNMEESVENGYNVHEDEESLRYGLDKSFGVFDIFSF